MRPGLFDVVLLVVSLFVLLANSVQYRRDRLPRNRFRLLAATALVGMANTLPDVTDGTPASLSTSSTPETVLNALSAVLVFAGALLRYRYWRERGTPS